MSLRDELKGIDGVALAAEAEVLFPKDGATSHLPADELIDLRKLITDYNPVVRVISTLGELFDEQGYSADQVAHLRKGASALLLLLVRYAETTDLPPIQD